MEIQQPATGSAALLIIDMINDLGFEEGAALKPKAEAAAAAIAKLRDEADAIGAPVVYVNDNFGQWHSERSRLVDHCLRRGSRGAAVVRQIAPRDDDFFVIKPQVSGFYATNLPVLLPKLQASRLILTGMAADVCVLFTAADAHMRDYELWAPADAVAAASDRRKAWALQIMRQSMGAETLPTDRLSLRAWVSRGRRGKAL